MLLLSNLIQVIFFIAGSILIIYAGKQDEQTRNPYLLIPALISIGLSAGFITGTIIALASIIIFFLPEKINKIIGKADLLLFYSLLTIIILNQNLLLTLIIFSTQCVTLFMLIINKNKEKQMPLIHYYAQAYSLTIITTIILAIFIGVFYNGF